MVETAHSLSDDLALTDRELDVLRLLSQGLSNRQIATSLALSQNTIKLHVASIFAKLSVATRTEAVATAVRSGVITLHQ
jgi:ATP/maltotriose-dependent transcriptional regulator MalT